MEREDKIKTPVEPNEAEVHGEREDKSKTPGEPNEAEVHGTEDTCIGEELPTLIWYTSRSQADICG
jgi:hypothetical protein